MARRKLKSTDTFPTEGELTVQAFRGEAPVIKDGKLSFVAGKTFPVGTRKKANKVVDSGRNHLNRFLAGELTALDPVGFICLGTGGYIGVADPNTNPTAPVAGDTALRAQIFQKAIASKEHPTQLSTKYIVIIGKGEATGAISEYGLKTVAGVLIAYRTMRTMTKADDVYFVCEWTLKH